MIDYFLSIIHPNVKKEWDSFYPENEIGIAKFLYHSHSFPCFHNPVDRNFRFKDVLHLIPEKYGNLKTRDLLPVAPYRLMKFILDNKAFIVEASKREEKYEQVIKLLDECPYGVTSVCNKHMHFRLRDGERLPKAESDWDRMSASDRLISNFLDVSNFEYFSSFSFEESSKRGERTSNDIREVKNALIVSYEDLDILFEELYPYCDEIKSEQTRVLARLHDEDVEEEFKIQIIENVRRNRYYRDFLQQEVSENDSIIKKKEYCISHLTRLDSFVSNKLSEEARLLDWQYPFGYDWYVKTKKDDTNGEVRQDGDDFLFDCIKNQDVIIQKNTTLLRYNELYANYPDGINAYNSAHKTIDENTGKEILPSPEEIINIDEDKLIVYQEYGKIIAFHNKWLNSQLEYSKICRDLLNDTDIRSWGAYFYRIPFKTFSYDGQEISMDYPVWHFFFNSCCHDESLDYSNNKKALETARNLGKFKNKTVFKTIIYDNLFSYIIKLKSKCDDDLVVLFNTSGVAQYESFNDYHFKYFRKLLTTNNIPFKEINEEFARSESKVLYVIVELISDNSRMKESCQRLINFSNADRSIDGQLICQECMSNIVYFSLIKEHSSAEMQKVIDITKEKIAKQKEVEERRRAEEQERQEAEQRRKNEQLQIQSNLNSKVSSWKTLPCGLPYYYLFYYYPTTCDFEATEKEWAHRRIVWNFKNDPDKDISYLAHNIALNHIVSGLKALLIMTFGEDLLHMLTLVCLPASTKVKNEARYKAFSEKLCAETGLKDGYVHTTFIEDGISKNSPDNPTGHSINPKVAFDDWFKGKYVLLFDDVVTKGDTMLRYKRILEEAGAIVVGGLCIGQTKHTRVQQ